VEGDPGRREAYQDKIKMIVPEDLVYMDGKGIDARCRQERSWSARRGWFSQENTAANLIQDSIS